MNQLNTIGTPKSKVRLESEIEKYREEGNWQKVLNLASQLVQNVSDKGLIQFLLGESKLELYLELSHLSNSQSATSNCNNSTTVNMYSGDNKERLLDEAKEHFQNCLASSSSSPLCMDSNLLLAKLYYVRQEYDRTVKAIETSGIENVTQVEKSLPLRVMKLVTESFAIKGMALEHLANQISIDSNSTKGELRSGHSSPIYNAPKTSEYIKQLKGSNTIESRIFCLGRSCDLTLRYLQNVEKQQGQYTLNCVGNILETALLRTPLLYIRNEQIDQAISQYRSILNAIECKATQNCRQIVARQLCELIMRSVTRSKWTPLDAGIQNNTGVWKPHRYAGQSLFNPTEREEELLLLIQIAEQQASANVVLERSVEFSRARRESLNNVIAIHDLFCIAFTPHRHYAIDLFEKAIKFSFENRHVWMQFALASHQCSKNPPRNVRIFEECVRLQPEDPLPLLFESKIYLQQMTDPENALRCAEQALQLIQQSSSSIVQHLYSRCYLLIGVCSAVIYEQQTELLRPKNVALLDKSINAFRQMIHCNPYDHLPHFHLALHLCKQKEVNQAVAHLQIALTLNPGHLPTIHLLLICLSALQKHQEAHDLCESALLEFPGQLLLLFIKAHLETYLSEDGDQQALLTAKELLRCCHRIACSSQSNGQSGNSTLATPQATTTSSVLVESASRVLSAQNSSYYLTGVNCDTLSLRLEQTLGEAACIDGAASFLNGPLVTELSEPSLSTLHHSQSTAAIATSASASTTNVINSGGSGNLSLAANAYVSSMDVKDRINAQLEAMQMQVWLMVAELFIRLDQLNEAEQCLYEYLQTTFGNFSHQLMYVRGRLYLARNQPLEAKFVLQNAISINPRHAPALQQLGLAYHLMGNHQIADKYLRDSLNCDSSCAQTWSIMGDVLESMGDYPRAVNCHLTALELEQIQPIFPFNIVPRIVLD